MFSKRCQGHAKQENSILSLNYLSCIFPSREFDNDDTQTHDQRHHNDNCLIFFQNREVDNCDIIMIMNDNDNEMIMK